MKKVVMEVEDFDKLAKFISTRTVPMMEVEKANEIMNILKNAKIAEIEEPSKKLKNEAPIPDKH